MRGKPVDMDLLMKKNELTPAVGNAKVNARGDQLGAGGQILSMRRVVGVFGKTHRVCGKPHTSCIPALH